MPDDFSSLVVRLGTDPATRDRVFVLNREDDGGLRGYTYGEFYRKSLEYGNMIGCMREALGTSGGGRFHVGAFMQNRPEFLFALAGCAFTNSTLVGINNAQVGEKLAFDMNNIDIDLLIADDAEQPGTGLSFAESALDAGRRFGFRGMAEDRVFSFGPGEGASTVVSLLARYRDSLPGFTVPRLQAQRPAVIIFTSGTTGAPKGIEVTWQKLIDVGVSSTRILGYTSDDVGYVCMPLNHSNSLYLNVMPALLNGARIMLRRRFSSSKFVGDITDSGATVWNSVGDPVHYVLSHLRESGGNPDLSHLPLRTVISTGTNSTDRKAFSRLFGLDIFTEVYGSTEAGVVAAVDGGTPDYSVGGLIKDVRILKDGPGLAEAEPAVVDASGRIENLDGASGEVVVSQASLGDSAFTGYYGLAGESEKRIVSIDGEPFFRMGDLGAVVREGGRKYLVFLGRVGDWIRFRGENFSPVDAERVVIRYPGVTNVGVIGVPQAEGTEDDPMYVIEPSGFDTFDVNGLIEYSRESLPHYMLPRFIRLKGALPMTDTMKLVKSRLKRDFYYRDPAADLDPEDVLYEVRDGYAVPFTAGDYEREISRYTDPTNRDRLTAFTKRDDIFEG